MLMPRAQATDPAPVQALFHHRWDDLHDPHVRALAWLLDAPDLLDPDAPQWQGRIATLRIDARSVSRWLGALEHAPAALHAFLDLRGVTRLGRYAEKLLAFYFAWCGTLVAHGLQVQAARHETIGEFDYLLREGEALAHLEFATKFYLFEATGASDPDQYFIGPNLADTLDAKMQKILQRQLALSAHPAAQPYLAAPVMRAQALIKGWLFYHAGSTAAPSAGPPLVHAPSLPTSVPSLPTSVPSFRPSHLAPSSSPPTMHPTMAPVPSAAVSTPRVTGVAAGHCQGFWCSVSEFARIDAEAFMILPRLAWLAPARVAADSVVGRLAMMQQLLQHFELDAMPVLIALMSCEDGVAREIRRGFVVPDDWRQRVHERSQRTVLRLAVP